MVGHSVVELVCLHWGGNYIFRCFLYALWLQRLKATVVSACISYGPNAL